METNQVKQILKILPYIISSRLSGSVELSPLYLDYENYLSRLTKSERHTLLYRYYYGYSLDQVATILDIHPQSVARIQEKAIRKIASMIEKEDQP